MAVNSKKQRDGCGLGTHSVSCAPRSYGCVIVGLIIRKKVTCAAAASPVVEGAAGCHTEGHSDAGLKFKSRAPVVQGENGSNRMVTGGLATSRGMTAVLETGFYFCDGRVNV